MNTKKGLTLVEILVAFVVFSLVTVLVIGVYVSHIKIYSNQNSQIEVASQSKIGIDEIVNETRQSQAIANTCSACGSDTTSSTVLILQLWPLDANGDPKDPTSNNYDYIVFKNNPADTTQLIKKVLPDASSSRTSSTKIIANNVATLNFTYNNGTPSLASQITITLTTSQTGIGKTQTSTQTKIADLRNK